MLTDREINRLIDEYASDPRIAELCGEVLRGREQSEQSFGNQLRLIGMIKQRLEQHFGREIPETQILNWIEGLCRR